MKTRRMKKRRKKNSGGMQGKDIPYRDYLRTSHWKSVRKAYRNSNLDQECIACCAKTVQLHHIVYDRIWRELPGDLIPLCGTCHQRLHDYLKRSGTKPDQLWTTLKFAFSLIPETRIARVGIKFKEAQDAGSEVSPSAVREAWLKVRRVTP
jgi:hypothetical protein